MPTIHQLLEYVLSYPVVNPGAVALLMFPTSRWETKVAGNAAEVEAVAINIHTKITSQTNNTNTNIISNKDNNINSNINSNIIIITNNIITNKTIDK